MPMSSSDKSAQIREPCYHNAKTFKKTLWLRSYYFELRLKCEPMSFTWGFFPISLA